MSAASTSFLVTTGCSSGLGLHALAQLIASPGSSSPSCVLIGTRSPLQPEAIALLDAAKERNPTMTYEQVTLDLSSLQSTKLFAAAVAERVGDGAIDRLLLNAAIWGAEGGAVGGWTQQAIVNHFAQHYLMHLLLPFFKRANDSIPRVVFTTSGLQNRVKSLDQLEKLLKAPSSGSSQDVYGASKFVSIAAARGWQIALAGRVEVVTVSPGLVPTTGLSRSAPWIARMAMHYVAPLLPFCTSLEAGAAGIAYAVTISSEEFEKLERQEGEGERRLVYLDPKHNLREVNPLVEDGGKELWERWMPGGEEIESWE